MRPEEDVRQAAEYWRSMEIEEHHAVVQRSDQGVYNLLARVAHNYTRGVADALEWALGEPKGMVYHYGQGAESVASEADEND